MLGTNPIGTGFCESGKMFLRGSAVGSGQRVGRVGADGERFRLLTLRPCDLRSLHLLTVRSDNSTYEIGFVFARAAS
jgi:hypothetical protein